MIIGKLYKVTKRIKLHTKPLKQALTIQSGIFIGETDSFFVFHDFRAKKANVVRIEQIRSK